MGNDGGRDRNKARTSLNCILCFRTGEEEDAGLATALKRPFKGSLAVLSPPYLVLTRKPLEWTSATLARREWKRFQTIVFCSSTFFLPVAFGRLFLAGSITVPIRSCEDVPTSLHCHREFIHSYFYLRVVSGLFFYFIPVSISLGNRQAALDNSFINMLMSFRQVNRSSTTLSTEFSDVCGSL